MIEQRVVQVSLSHGPVGSARPLDILLLVEVEVPDDPDQITIEEMERIDGDLEDAARAALRPYLNNHAYFKVDGALPMHLSAAPRWQRSADLDDLPVTGPIRERDL